MFQSILNAKRGAPLAQLLESLRGYVDEALPLVSTTNSVVGWVISNEGKSPDRDEIIQLMKYFNVTQISDFNGEPTLRRMVSLVNGNTGTVTNLVCNFYSSIFANDESREYDISWRYGKTNNVDDMIILFSAGNPLNSDSTPIDIPDSVYKAGYGPFFFGDYVQTIADQNAVVNILSDICSGCLDSDFSLSDLTSILSKYDSASSYIQSLIHGLITAMASGGISGLIEFISTEMARGYEVTNQNGVLVPPLGDFSTLRILPFQNISNVVSLAADVLAFVVGFKFPMLSMLYSIITSTIKGVKTSFEEATTPRIIPESMFNTIGAPIRFEGATLPSDVYNDAYSILSKYGVADLISPYGMIRIYAIDFPNVSNSNLTVDLCVAINYCQTEVTIYNTIGYDGVCGTVDSWALDNYGLNSEVSDLVTGDKLTALYEASMINAIKVCLCGMSPVFQSNAIRIPSNSPISFSELGSMIFKGRDWLQIQSLGQSIIGDNMFTNDCLRIGTTSVPNDTNPFINFYRAVKFSAGGTGTTWTPGIYNYQPMISAPQYDESSLIISVVVNGALAIGAAIAASYAFKVARNALTAASIRSTAAFTSAYNTALQNPTAANLRAFRKARRNYSWLGVLAFTHPNVVSNFGSETDLEGVHEGIDQIITLISG